MGVKNHIVYIGTSNNTHSLELATENNITNVDINSGPNEDILIVENEIDQTVLLKPISNISIDVALETIDVGMGGGNTTPHESPYKGDYSVVPDVVAQKLPTKNKYLSKDITVFAIPYWETSNEAGTTIVIGGKQIYG